MKHGDIKKKWMKVRRRIVLFIFSYFISSFVLAAQDKIKVACVGNSVTYGYGLQNRDRDASPVRLQ